MKNVTITWKAFGKPTYAVLMIEDEMSDWLICEELFKETNTYAGKLWDALQYSIPANRTHTALSVGDEIDIDGTVYRCEPVGWQIIDTYEPIHWDAALSGRDL
jgi:hypothetical protein